MNPEDMHDPLLEYRVGVLEKSHAEMSSALLKLVGEIRFAKWVIGGAYAVAQPIAIGLIIYLMTR